jgi:hypothetical protein
MRQAPESPVAVAQIAVDALPADAMRWVVGVRQREAFQHAELRLDEVQPGGLCRCRHGVDVQPAQQRQEPWMVMDVAQVVQDHEQPFTRIAGPQASEGLADLGDAFAPAKYSVEAVPMDVIEAQERLGAVPAAPAGIRRAAVGPGGQEEGAHAVGERG